MDRLTKPNSDYCHDICGSVNGCPRITKGKKRCSGYDLYERLKWYENILGSIKSVNIDCESLSAEELRTIIEKLFEDDKSFMSE